MKRVESNTPKGLLSNTPLLVSFLLVVDSLHFVFARVLHEFGMPPDAGAFYVLGMAALQLFVIALIRKRLNFSLLKENLIFFVSIGFMVAVSTAMNYAAVAWINPGTASMLGKTSVLFGLALGILWLKEKLRLPEVIGSGIAILGVFAIAFQPGGLLQLGSLVVLTSTFLYSLHAAVVKRYSADMDMLEFLFFRLAMTASFAFLITAVQGHLVWPSLEVWGIILLVSTVDVVISRGLYYLALRILDLTYHSIVLTLSPVVAVMWTFVLFTELPTLQEIVGGSAVLIGVLVVSLAQARRKRLIRQTYNSAIE